METDNDWYWDRYWQSDRISACSSDGSASNYVPAIRTGWMAYFKTFPDGSRLLDIGTGNGAIAVLAQDIAASDGLRFEIHGVDRANIEPARFVHSAARSLATIRFHGLTRAESMPFPDAYFDGISGQYALEYTDMPATVRELCRVAKTGTRLRFVLHAEGAVPVEGAARDLQEIDFLTRQLKLPDRARTLMRATFAFERATTYSPELEKQARSAREDYLAAARQADERFPGVECKSMYSDLLGSVRRAWDQRRNLTIDHILSGLDVIETEIRAHAARLTDMRNAALSNTAAKKLAGYFRDSGCTHVNLTELHPVEDPRFWGWELTLEAG